MQRKKYSLLKSKLEYDPRCGQQDNPLSQEDEVKKKS